MGLAIPALKYLIKSSKKYHFKGPLLTLGNQDIYADIETTRKYFKTFHLKPKEVKKINLTTSSDLIKINPQAKNYLHASTFFELLGIDKKNYFDIDKFNFDKPKITHDLQEPITSKYNDFFNLIIDSGTIEHIFDIKSVMFNIARITKVGGYVLHFSPTHNFINHGFYQLSPTFFHDFYSQNGFEIVEAYYIEIRPNCYRFYEYHQDKDYTGLYINPLNRISSCFLVKKINNPKVLVYPNQYYYEKSSQNSAAVQSDFDRTILDKIVNRTRNIIPFQLHSYFFSIWYLAKGLFQKRKHFDLTFKDTTI